MITRFMSPLIHPVQKTHYAKKEAASESAVFVVTPIIFMNTSPIAAIFDVDGTLIAGDSLEMRFAKYLWRYGELRFSDLIRHTTGTLRTAQKGQSIRRANKAYLRGKATDHYRRLAADCFDQHIKYHLLPGAIARVHWHRQQGHQIILISGTLDALLQPLAHYLQATVAIGTAIATDATTLTGEITGQQPFGITKAEILLQLQNTHPMELAHSFAYGNDFADRHVLALTGNPIATNPDFRLRQFAVRHHWQIETFTPGSQFARLLSVPERVR